MEGLDKRARTPNKRKTRATVAEEEIVRQKSRERQQKRRANMSSQKKQCENEKANKGTTPESRSFFRNVFSQLDSRLLAKNQECQRRSQRRLRIFLLGTN